MSKPAEVNNVLPFQQPNFFLNLFYPKGIRDLEEKCILAKELTSAHFFGNTSRPILPASLALSIFSNKGVITEFELEHCQGCKQLADLHPATLQIKHVLVILAKKHTRCISNQQVKQILFRIAKHNITAGIISLRHIHYFNRSL